MMQPPMATTAISRAISTDSGTTKYMELCAQGSPPRASYRIDEVANMLGVSRGTVYAEVRAGRLRTVKIRMCTIVLAADLDRYLQKTPRGNSTNMPDKPDLESRPDRAK